MFSKSQTRSAPGKMEPRARETTSPPQPSIIGSDMRISGDLRTDGDVQIDGTVDGDIQSTSLTVGRTAQINGELAADTVRVLGQVNGRIRGREVTLLESAEVNGDILHEVLEIARGASVEGMVKRQGREEKSQINLVVSDGEPATSGPSSSSGGTGSKA